MGLSMYQISALAVILGVFALLLTAVLYGTAKKKLAPARAEGLQAFVAQQHVPSENSRTMMPGADPLARYQDTATPPRYMLYWNDSNELRIDTRWRWIPAKDFTHINGLLIGENGPYCMTLYVAKMYTWDEVLQDVADVLRRGAPA